MFCRESPKMFLNLTILRNIPRDPGSQFFCTSGYGIDHLRGLCSLDMLGEEVVDMMDEGMSKGNSSTRNGQHFFERLKMDI